MTTPSRDRRSLVAGPCTGRFLLGRFFLDRGSVTSLAVTCALVLAPRPSLAGPAATAEPQPAEGAPGEEPGQDDQVQRAMAAYQRGTQNYNLAQYEAALADFTEAASLYASPDFQYNIGLCYEKLGKYEDAIRAFATYLRAKPDAEDRPNVENRIHALEQEIEQRKREAEEREAEEREAEEREARLAERERDEPRPQQPTQTDAPPSTVGQPLIIAGAVLAGVGAVVALGGGIGFGVVARKRSAAVEEVQTGGNPEELSFDEANELDRAGKRFEGVQIGLAAGGAALAVAGAVLLALGLRKRERAASTQATSGSRTRIGRSWRPSALLGPATAGLVLTSRF